MRQPEHKFQAWTCRFLNAAVLPPFWFTSVDHAHADMKNPRRAASLAARGVKSGCPDMYVAQDGRSVWLELKWGRNKPSGAQSAVVTALNVCSVPAFFCWSVHDVLTALQSAGLNLHGNAENLATEYQERVEASIAAPPKKRGPSAPRKPKTSISAIARFEAIRAKTR